MKLICTRSDRNISDMTNITHPIIRSFASKWGAKFVVLDNLPDWMNHKDDRLFCQHYRIMNLYHMFKLYNMILCIDSDVIITPECPNPFDIIPADHIGTVYEDIGSRKKDRENRIFLSQKKFGEIGWRNGYINTGFFMASAMHKDIFMPVDGMFWDGRGYDDVHLGYQIFKNKLNVHELSYKWNHMTMMSEEWNGNPDRFKSYIIHYAGQGIFDKGVKNRLQQIKKDCKKLYG